MSVTVKFNGTSKDFNLYEDDNASYLVQKIQQLDPSLAGVDMNLLSSSIESGTFKPTAGSDPVSDTSKFSSTVVFNLKSISMLAMAETD